MFSAPLAAHGTRLMASLLAPACLALVSLVLLVACSADSPASFAASGKALAAKGEHQAAILQFKSALQLAPRSAEVRLLLGQSLLAARDAGGAAVELNKALDDGAPPVQVLPLLSKALVLTGDYRRLVSTYGELSLDDAAAQAELKTNVATAWGALADRPRTEANLAAALKALPDYAPAQLLKARVLAGQRNYEAATALVDAALAKDSKSYDAWLLRGELLYFGKGDAKGAEAAYRQAVAIDPSNVLAQAAIISARIRERDLVGAREQANQMRAAAPKHPHTVLVDAQLAYLDNKHGEARELLQRLLRVVPDHAGVLILAGAAEFQLGSVVQAAAHFGKALQLYPSLDVVRLNLAEVEVRLGQYAKAVETLKPMLAASPPKVAALSLAGDAELRLGRAANAERYYQQAAQLAPNDEKVQTAAALTRMWSGDAAAAIVELRTLSEKSAETYADEALFAAHLRRREFDAALKTLDVMERKRPGRAVVQELRGRVHMARNDLPQARRGFEEARRIEPTLTAALVSLADIDVLEGQFEAAAQRLQAGIKAEPKNSVLLLSMAELKARQGKPVEEVRSLLVEAVNAAPASAEPRLRLIGFLLRKRLFNDALAASQQATAALPADPMVLQAVGSAQMQAGDLEQAINTFRRLAAAVPASAQPQMLLAEVYAAAGKPAQVEAAIVKALEIDPNLAPAQSALVDLFVRSKRLRAATDYIARVKSQRPQEPVGYVLESAFFMRQNDREGAIKALREGLAKTNNPAIAERLFTLLSMTGNTAEAERFGLAWMQKHPKHVGVEYLLSVGDMGRNNLALAEKRLQRVVAAMPNHHFALNNLAWVTLQMGGKGAAVHAQRAVDLQPEKPEFMDTLAQALAAEKKIKPALDLQRRAIELAPANNDLRLNLAKLALQAGDKAAARAELERLKALGTSFKAQNEVASLLAAL